MSRRLPVLALAALALAGCSVLREPPAEQLYRLGAPSPGASPQRADPPPVRVGLENGAFPREAAGVRMATVEGAQVSYLAGARWAAPAQLMFDQALIRAFASTPDATLLGRGAGGSADTLLRVDVTAFEATYDQGAEAAPVVRVAATARVTRRQDRALLGERVFTAERRASENRVSAVVDAYDAATAEATGAIAAWSADTARRTAPAG